MGHKMREAIRDLAKKGTKNEKNPVHTKKGRRPNLPFAFPKGLSLLCDFKETEDRVLITLAE